MRLMKECGQEHVKSLHFLERQRQRSLPDELIRITIAYGQKFYQGSEVVYFLSRKRIRRVERIFGTRLDAEVVRSADGIVVVSGQNQTLVTAYRNPKYIRHLRRCS